MAAQSSASSSKQPDLNGQGFRPQVNMTVQPPRQEDLQQSYASIVGNDASPKGWYGSMSMSPLSPTLHAISKYQQPSMTVNDHQC